MIDRAHMNGHYWVKFVPVPIRPWRLVNEHGQYLRRTTEPGTGIRDAFLFHTADAALSFARRHGVPLIFDCRDCGEESMLDQDGRCEFCAA